MSITVTLYERATGVIRETAIGPALDIIKNLAPGLDMIDGNWPADRFWIDDGSAKARPALPVPSGLVPADGVATWRMDGLPDGTAASVVFVRGADGVTVPRDDPGKYPHSGPVAGGVLEWSTTRPGIYRLVLVPPHPWKRLEADITASPIQDNPA